MCNNIKCNRLWNHIIDSQPHSQKLIFDNRNFQYEKIPLQVRISPKFALRPFLFLSEDFSPKASSLYSIHWPFNIKECACVLLHEYGHTQQEKEGYIRLSEDFSDDRVDFHRVRFEFNAWLRAYRIMLKYDTSISLQFHMFFVFVKNFKTYIRAFFK